MRLYLVPRFDINKGGKLVIKANGEFIRYDDVEYKVQKYEQLVDCLTTIKERKDRIKELLQDIQ